jgi:SAM-dependent methyltransferase
MKGNKNHWYDGLFYDKFIAPNQDSLFEQIRNLIEPNSKIIDVGCGTGRFSFKNHDICHSILGIDLSKKNIDRANYLLNKNPKSNITFRHSRLDDIHSNGNNHFDYAILTYVLHEINEDERVKFLREIAQIADKIIIGDYLSDQKTIFWKWINEIVEFLAGKEHYINYKNYISNGGLKTLVDQANFEIITESKDRPLTSHLVVLAGK